jgi:hypothetical protein
MQMTDAKPGFLIIFNLFLCCKSFKVLEIIAVFLKTRGVPIYGVNAESPIHPAVHRRRISTSIAVSAIARRSFGLEVR